MSKKISQLTTATDVTVNDFFQVVDLEDPTMAASGTNKKVSAQTLGNFLPVTATGSSASRSLKDRFADTVNVKDFGAVGDGVTDDTVAIQAALNFANTVIFSDGTYRITSSLVINKASQQVLLAGGCTVSLDTTTIASKAFDVQATNAVVRGGRITTTLRTLNFLVRLAGANSKLQDSVLFFATKSTIAPIDGVNIPYNRGGVELRGNGAEVSGCEIYNQEGAGVVTYADRMTIRNSIIRDNVLGIHASIESGQTSERTVAILGNEIFDNNVNSASGAVGVLASQYTNLRLSGNRITNNGEHGTYIYSVKSVIENNFVSGNFRNGLKVRASKKTVISNNIVVDNNTEGVAGVGELVLQLQTGDTVDPTVEEVIVSNNVASGELSIGIITAWVSAGLILQNIVVADNIANKIQLAFTTGATITGNRVLNELSVGAAFVNSPASQSNAVVKGNVCATLSMGRCVDSTFEGNICTTFESGGVFPSRNSILNNRMTLQTTQINRGSFDVFSGNYVNCSVLGSVPVLEQNATQSQNNNKQIIGNRFVAHADRVINDSSSSVSGNKNVICNNVFDSTNDALSFWGSGHTVMGNVNINTGGTGFVGCNNSWLIGNSPIIGLRAGTTGNVVS